MEKTPPWRTPRITSNVVDDAFESFILHCRLVYDDRMILRVSSYIYLYMFVKLSWCSLQMGIVLGIENIHMKRLSFFHFYYCYCLFIRHIFGGFLAAQFGTLWHSKFKIQPPSNNLKGNMLDGHIQCTCNHTMSFCRVYFTVNLVYYYCFYVKEYMLYVCQMLSPV